MQTIPKIAMVAMVAMAMLLGLSPIHGVTAVPPAHARADTAPVVIGTPSELADYLKTTPTNESPLSLLPTGARKRFLDTLVWGQKGLGGFGTADLEQYLTDAQIREVLTLFDAERYASGLHGRAEPLTQTQRRAPETPLEKGFDKFYFAHADATHRIDGASATTLYDRLLAPWQHPRRLAELEVSDVGLLFRAAEASASISHDARYLDDLRVDLTELHRRGIATSGQITAVHAALVAARRFTDANALASAYPAAGIEPLPALKRAPNINDGSPTALVMLPDGKSMLHTAIDMQAPLRIIVIAGCHFSKDAARAIHADPQLDTLFHEHAIWLTGANESLTDVLAWNREFPRQPMNVAWRNSEWHMLDSWLIPTFYVFRGGKQVDQWNGWGPDGMERLKEHLRRNGLPN